MNRNIIKKVIGNFVSAADLPEEPNQINIPVYVLIYGLSFNDIEAKSLEIVGYLERGTMYHGIGDPFLDSK